MRARGSVGEMQTSNPAVWELSAFQCVSGSEHFGMDRWVPCNLVLSTFEHTETGLGFTDAFKATALQTFDI